MVRALPRKDTVTAEKGIGSLRSMTTRRLPLLVLLFALLVGAGLIWRLLSNAQPAQPALALAPTGAGLSRAMEPDLVMPASRSALSSGSERQVMEGNQRSGELTGRCMTYLDQGPLADVGVTFLREGQNVVQTSSDGLGEFTVELPVGGFDQVQVRTPAGWWCAEHGLRDGEYRVLLAPNDVGPLRATLVDRSTGERVPDYFLRLQDSNGWRETLSSDAEGRLTSEVFFARGAVAVQVIAEEIGGQRKGYVSSYIEHVPDGLSPAWRSVALTVGATYRLELDNPGQVPIKRLMAFLTTPSWVDQIVDWPTAAVHVREGDLPWARFPRPAPWRDNPQLVITDSGGQWRGSASVSSTEGVQAQSVVVRLERMLRVRGRVFNLEGEALARADVVLTRVDAGSAGRGRESLTSGSGLFLFVGVRPGAYELFVRHKREGMASRRLELTPESEDLNVILEPYDVAGDIAGVVRSLTGSFRGDLMLSLRPAEGEPKDLPARTIWVAWEEVGANFEAPFRFEGVPHGRYRLDTFLRRADFGVKSDQPLVAPPNESIDILVRDDKPRFRLNFVVRDAVTRRWLGKAQVRILDSSGELVFEGPAMEQKAARLFADGEPMQWKVQHPGYHSKFGGRAQFDALTKNGRHTAILELEKD